MSEFAARSADPAQEGAPAATPDELLPEPASLTTIRVRGRSRIAQGKAFLDLNAGVLGAGIARPSGPAPLQPGRGTVEELIAYWSHLRRGVDLPSPADLNYTAVASGWPNTVLLHFDPGPGEMPEAATPRAVRVTGGSQAASARAIPLTPEVGAWIVALAREAIRGAEVVREIERFPESSGGWLEAVLLPLSMRGIPDHALYHLRRA